jgi:plasmid stabilization system protein ParE
MKVILSPQAEAQLRLRRGWWQKNRPKAPDRFEQELAHALRRISDHPIAFPVYSEKGGRTVRRYLLTRTHCHLYFELLPDSDEVWILAAWGAARRRGPRLSER